MKIIKQVDRVALLGGKLHKIERLREKDVNFGSESSSDMSNVILKVAYSEMSKDVTEIYIEKGR